MVSFGGIVPADRVRPRIHDPSFVQRQQRRGAHMKRRLFTGSIIGGLLLTSAAFAQTTITVAAGAVGQELELTRAAAQRYMEQNPGVTVNVLDTPDMADDRLGLYLQFFQTRSSEIDVYQIDEIGRAHV